MYTHLIDTIDQEGYLLVQIEEFSIVEIYSLQLYEQKKVDHDMH